MSAGKGRLIAVSNRVGPIRDTPQAGGLAVALVDALRERGGLWFGFSGHHSANPDPSPRHDHHEGLHTAVIDLPATEYQGYYNGFANGCLWPLCHFRPDLLRYRAADYAAYLRVNERFADALLPLLHDEDVLWVHDFHLVPLAAALRARGAKQRIGFFLHVPFPARDLLLTLPQYPAWLAQLASYDLVGVQTAVHLERLHDVFAQLLGASHTSEGWRIGTHTVRTGAFPVGIDVETFEQFAQTPRATGIVRRMKAALRGRSQMIGVDRLDYAKGLLRRLDAYEHFLARHPRAHGKIEYLQIAPVSRGEIAAYQSFREDMERTAARINGAFSRYDWTPLRYLNSPLTRPTLAALYRASRIGLVTPLRDGMNLVAKEYVAAQDADDPGVLVLSQFAGAARQMSAAVLTNPYDADAVADAIETARQMPATERRARHAELMQGLRTADSHRWQHDYLAALSA